MNLLLDILTVLILLKTAEYLRRSECIFHSDMARSVETSGEENYGLWVINDVVLNIKLKGVRAVVVDIVNLRGSGITEEICFWEHL